MKAFIHHNYGPADVLRLSEVAKPEPAANELQIKVHAFSLNPEEMHMMHGMFAVRPITGFRRPKVLCLKADIAGVVEAIGDAVSDFKIGDKVMGRANKGGQAQFTCVPQDRLVHKPEALSFEQAAALPLAGVTALQAVTKNGNVHKGMRVLINGASGGIGTYAVQLAKHFDGEVTAVCSGKNIDLVTQLGADHAIDYHTGDFTRTRRSYELIIDLVGNRSLSDMRSCLSKNGKCLMVGFSTPASMFRALIGGPLSSNFSTQKVGVMMASFDKADLQTVADLAATGDLEATIDKAYPFEMTPKAMHHLATVRAKGKIVVRLDAGSE
ncbi:NAD(P)-dependent alcohol dehydrogenase [Maritalea porphyrae]|uniref:NAD(P)-dependent alcohol dehydrogenase n=1 Tax=Maritalea porphyrae TaxID=880732 RepID=UPI0022AF88B0|nr:NAD(P)-dependent alcohol dehydrogenase [Maritalea porphyrae]MCZ4271363.1 NAD(P)-dependent alcohol dehydrogenase [Maritalea porphyrae]